MDIHAIHVANCNCAYGCHYQFNALLTVASRSHRVNQNRKRFYGDILLDGLTAGMIVKWPGLIHEGNGERQIIIDDRSSQAQREALEKILKGQDTEKMATICWVINEMTTIHHETLFKRVLVEANIDSRKGRVNSWMFFI